MVRIIIEQLIFSIPQGHYKVISMAERWTVRRSWWWVLVGAIDWPGPVPLSSPLSTSTSFLLLFLSLSPRCFFPHPSVIPSTVIWILYFFWFLFLIWEIVNWIRAFLRFWVGINLSVLPRNVKRHWLLSRLPIVYLIRFLFYSLYFIDNHDGPRGCWRGSFRRSVWLSPPLFFSRHRMSCILLTVDVTQLRCGWVYESATAASEWASEAVGFRRVGCPPSVNGLCRSKCREPSVWGWDPTIPPTRTTVWSIPKLWCRATGLSWRSECRSCCRAGASGNRHQGRWVSPLVSLFLSFDKPAFYFCFFLFFLSPHLAALLPGYYNKLLRRVGCSSKNVCRHISTHSVRAVWSWRPSESGTFKYSWLRETFGKPCHNVWEKRTSRLGGWSLLQLYQSLLSKRVAFMRLSNRKLLDIIQIRLWEAGLEEAEGTLRWWSAHSQGE